MQSSRFQDIVLPTKLHRPRTREHDVLRPRLLAHLDACLQQRVTLISAPAGFGKTVLAAQWLEHLPRRAAWLSLDEQDSDLERVLRYLIAAIHTVAPGLCSEVEPLLAVPTLPPAAYVADALGVALLALSEPVVLVLDDYHTVRAKAVHTMLMRLVPHLPASVHVAILTRVDPPWPLARWRVRQWLSELRAAVLCFSPEEAQAFFCHHWGPALAAETVAMLHQRTEGWIAGLQLAQVSLATSDNPEEFARSFSASDYLIVDFLMDEVLAHQAPEIQTFLMLTSLLERFCAPPCDVLLAEASQPRHSVQLAGVAGAGQSVCGGAR
jgi:LuxR family maltose regulon positive regulatory protein